jgi:hypothetical protein
MILIIAVKHRPIKVVMGKNTVHHLVSVGDKPNKEKNLRYIEQSISICIIIIKKNTFSFQPASSYLNVSLQSIGDRTTSLFSRSFNFLQSSTSSSPLCPTQNNHQIGSNSGVYRNQSRRKYQTSSLRNPYRRSSTNFPVRGHEAMFLPEFSIKGKITEADFEVELVCCFRMNEVCVI